MTDDPNNFRLSSRSDFSVDPFNKVESASPELPSPTLISKAVIPEIGTSKWRKWVGGITDEASGGVGI